MVAIVGAKTYGKKIENMLLNKDISAEFIGDSFRKIDNNKIQNHNIVHFIFSPTVTPIGIISLMKMKRKHKKIIITWIGTDVLWAKTKFFKTILAKFGNNLVDLNLCVSPNLKKELEEIKIKVKLQSLPFFSLYEIRPVSNYNKVLVYLPDKLEYMWDFFQGNIIKKLVKEFPEVEFIILGNSGKKFQEKNVKSIEWANNMEELYAQSKAVIRLPKHDGLSNTILEALSMGRTMITSNSSIPHCNEVTNYEEIKKILADTLEKPVLNNEGSKYVFKNYNLEKIIDELISIYNSLK